MTRFTDKEIEDYAVGHIAEARDMKNFHPDRFNALIKNAEGIIGRTLSLFKKGDADKNEDERQKIIAIIEAMMPKSGYMKLRSAISAMPSKRPELMLMLEKTISAVRDLIVFKEARNAKSIFFVSESEAGEYVKAISIKKLLSVYDALIRAHEYCTKNANVGTILADLESKIKLS